MGVPRDFSASAFFVNNNSDLDTTMTEGSMQMDIPLFTPRGDVVREQHV